MRFDLLEKLVLVVTVLAVLFVAAVVGLFSFVFAGGMRSGIAQVVIDSDEATMNWLDARRRASGVQTATIVGAWTAPSSTPAVTTNAQGGPARPAAPSGGGQSQGGGGGQAQAQLPPLREMRYFESGGQIPPAEQVPGIPWLRAQPGVTYARPQPVSEMVYRKYQSFEDTWDLVQEGGGEFAETPQGTAYQVNWVDENSLLYSRIGLRPGDQVISVNGQPIGTSLAAGKAMFDQLKGERRFAVMVLRQGQPLVLSFSVQ